jgi:predicted nucleotidyltransferase
MASNHLTRVAETLAEILGDDCMLIGGMAVAAWGHVRATQDVDFVARGEPQALQERLQAAGIATTLHRGDPIEDPLPWVLRGDLEEVRFEVIASPIPLDWTAGTPVELPDGARIHLVGLEDLIRLKVVAGGNRDLWDVAKLVQAHPEQRDAALARADARGLGSALLGWLNDPRL